MKHFPFSSVCKRIATGLGPLALSFTACAGSDEPSFKPLELDLARISSPG